MLAEGLITGLIDGLMSVLMLALMFAYSVQLDLSSCSRSHCTAALRLALFRIFDTERSGPFTVRHRKTPTSLNRAGSAETEAAQRENERESQWLNRYAEYVNATCD